MKKFVSLVFVILLLAGIYIPFAMAENNDDVFDVEIENGAEYDGYIFKTVSEDAAQTEESDFTEIYDNVYQADSIEDIEESIDAEDIEYIEPDYLVYLAEAEVLATTDDPYYSSQWNLNMINAEAYWDSGLSGDGVIIAVIDSGLYTGHEDINYDNVAIGKNIIDGSTDTEDKLGHGTYVTGVISAARNNGVGIAGIMDDATIVPLKVFGTTNETSISYVSKAIYEAVDTYNCDVINMSFGSDVGTQTLYGAICYAEANDVLMVAAVGNNYATAPGIYYPAAYAEVIGVGGVQSTGAMYAGSQRNASVFITAPGQSVRTLGFGSPTQYVYTTGTSLAAPHITAAAAIARSYDQDITLSEFKKLLQNSAVDKGESGYDTSYGYGIIDLELFMDNLVVIDDPIPVKQVFTDVSPNSWALDSINYMVEKGLFFGTSATTFSPNKGMTRAMFVTVLGRLYESAGGTVENANDSFTDTVNGSYYSKYVSWAVTNGVMYGYGGGKFGPNDVVTREQMVTVFYRYAVFAGMKAGTINMSAYYKYADASSVSSWAKTAMAWAVQNGIIYGTYGKLMPKDTTTRAQAAAIFERYMVNPVGV